jgi:hypothetical protein
MSRIFISYRRKDSAGYAGRLYDRLQDHFGEDLIFMDVDNIPPGEDFVEVLENAVSSCSAVVAVIGSEWLSATDVKTGLRRLDNPNDFVRIELAAALANNIRVIPVLVDGADMPSEVELPDVLKRLARRNALEVRHESFNGDSAKLISALEQIMKPVVPPASAASPLPESPPQSSPRRNMQQPVSQAQSPPAQTVVQPAVSTKPQPNPVASKLYSRKSILLIVIFWAIGGTIGGLIADVITFRTIYSTDVLVGGLIAGAATGLVSAIILRLRKKSPEKISSFLRIIILVCLVTYVILFLAFPYYQAREQFSPIVVISLALIGGGFTLWWMRRNANSTT